MEQIKEVLFEAGFIAGFIVMGLLTKYWYVWLAIGAGWFLENYDVSITSK